MIGGSLCFFFLKKVSHGVWLSRGVGCGCDATEEVHGIARRDTMRLGDDPSLTDATIRCEFVDGARDGSAFGVFKRTT
jgi:hypothetical protein